MELRIPSNVRFYQTTFWPKNVLFYVENVIFSFAETIRSETSETVYSLILGQIKWHILQTIDNNIFMYL
jgi:hypothetical protein